MSIIKKQNNQNQLIFYTTLQKQFKEQQKPYNILITSTPKKDHIFIYFSNIKYSIESNSDNKSKTIYISPYNVKMKLFDTSNVYYNTFFKFIKSDELMKKSNLKYFKYMFFVENYKPDFIIYVKIHNDNLFEHFLAKSIFLEIFNQIQNIEINIKIQNKTEIFTKKFNIDQYLDEKIYKILSFDNIMQIF